MAEGQRVLGGRYLLKDKVGTGGMATVFRAQDQVLDRTVAVKIMLPQYAGDATFAARFKQEAQAAAGLSSPYIVGVYDWGKDGDTYYIVMEYLRGTDLKSGIRSHGALDPKKVAQIGSQICGALSVAHKHEIIHRDIKPQNIMVLPDGNIKVMDFGIARAKNSHLTQDNNVLGTAHYVSPEQTRGQELGPTSDIYSLGVVMYECATGRVPFDGDDAISVALKQVNELPVPPSQINPGIDSDLERIILKCMEKDPANRFQTADELRQVLNAYATGRAVNVAEPTRVIPGVAAGAGMGATETQQMARPAGVMGQTAARPGAQGSAPYGDTGSFDAQGKKSAGKGKIAAIVVGVIAVIALAVFAATSLFGKDAGVSVPYVLNQTEEEATKALEDAGFKVKLGDPTWSDSVEEGKVVDQTPDGNKKAKKGSEVTIILSKGIEPAEQVEMINITGMPADEAASALSKLKLKGNPIEEENTQVEEGTVFWQGTNTGTMVDEGSTIEYKVATAPDTASVPGVLGKSAAEASNMLSNAGFKVERADGDYSDTYPEGTVMAQSATGTVEAGSTITITISKGANPNAEIPNVVGKTESTARADLQAAGFPSTTQQRASDTVPRGSVISQSATGSARRGTTITLVISSGPANTGGDSGASGGNSGHAGNNSEAPASTD